MCGLLAATLCIVGATNGRPTPATAAEAAPYYENLTPACSDNNQKPCHRRDDEDAYYVEMGECNDTITNFCFTATRGDGTALPSKIKIVAGVSAYKVHTPTVEIAGYESFVNAYYLPDGATLTSENFGSSDRPKDQSGNGGRLDLSPQLSADDTIKVTIKYKTTAYPQYSVLVSNEGSMDFSLTGQDLTATLTGKPAQLAIESAAQHINFDTEKNDDPDEPWTDRCGIPSMQFVVCNVDRAESDALAFYARTKTFVFGPGATVPGPIWVSTNATYFHMPSISWDETTNSQALQLKTAAPHFRKDGTTLHTGNFSAFLPNGILQEWQIEKTEESLKKLLAGRIEKAGAATTVNTSYAITEDGVKVDFPEISYSAPTMKVGPAPEQTPADVPQAPAPTGNSGTQETPAATPTPAPSTTTSTTAPIAPVDNIPSRTVKKNTQFKLTSLLKPKGRAKTSWRVKGPCKIARGQLKTPKSSATCVLTLKQVKSGKQPASTKQLKILIA